MVRGLLMSTSIHGFRMVPSSLRSLATLCHPPPLHLSSPFRTSLSISSRLLQNPPFSAPAFPPSFPLHLTGIRCSSTHTHNKETELIVDVQTHDSLNLTPEIQAVVKQLETDGCLALEQALDCLEDVEPAEVVELSVLVCSDRYIKKLNNEWLGENRPTDVLSFPQEQPPNFSSTLLLGDIVISVETAARQAGERGHSLLDEMRILLVHGLLHLFGYDHEESPEAANKMEDQEGHILMNLGWKGKGLIAATYEEAVDDAGGMGLSKEMEDSDVDDAGSKPIWQRKPVFKLLFCDMDGTLLNSKGEMSAKTVGALKAAIARGVKVIVATGKSRAAAMTILDPVGLGGKNGIVSGSSPGVFVQGLVVYGEGGNLLHSEFLLPDICEEAFRFSMQKKMPLVAFSNDRIVTLFDHPSIEELHMVYKEAKAEIMPSVEYILNNLKIQKLLFIDSREGIDNSLRPYWSKAISGRARVIQAIDYMLEIIPTSCSKGNGVKLLLDHLEVDPDDAMAIGDGENDIEMLELVGWGVAMANGSPQTLAIADAHVRSNDEDGVVEALERFVLT